jgi:hypothetical protein
MSSRIYDQKNVLTAKRSARPAAPSPVAASRPAPTGLEAGAFGATAKSGGRCVATGPPSNESVQRNDALCCVRFSFESCLVATKNNHINCLIRAHNMGCPLGKSVVEMAKQLQHTECWMYAKLNVNTTL